MAALWVAAAWQKAEPESPLTIIHILSIPSYTDFALSPDGKSLAAAMSGMGKESVLIVTDPAKPGEAVAPSEGRDREPDWSPDGRKIAFISNRGGGWHLFVAGPGDKEAQQLTRHQGEDRRPRWSPNGNQIAYLSNRLGSDTGWDLWVIPSNEAKPRRLTSDPFDEEDPRWSPDGKWIAYTYRGGRHVERRIAVVESSDAERPQIRELLPETWEGDSHSPRWSPDGRTVAFVSDHGGMKSIFVVPSGGGLPEPLVESGLEETDPAWSPDGAEIAHVTNREGNLVLSVTTVSTRKTRLLTPGSGVYRNPWWSPDGDAVICFYEGPTYPRDVWRFSKREGRSRWTESLPSELDVRKMVRPELVRYPSFDGRTITGFLYLPQQASADAPVPLVVHPHGGPTSQWTNGWDPFVQFLAQQGYAVFAPNVRGSSGFGRAFEDLNDKDWGRGDLEDLVAGARELVKRPEIRDDRMGIWGVSYGGFLTLAAIGRYPELFACAVEAVGMPDLEALYRETNTEGRSYLDRELGPLRGNLELYRELSPVRRVDKIKTPLLSFHGADYPLVPLATKRGFFLALQKPGYPLQDFVFEGDQGRATYRFDLYPATSRFYMEKILEFFQVYL